MIPSAVPLLFALPGGIAVAQGLKSIEQFVEPGPDPESAARCLQELLEEAG